MPSFTIKLDGRNVFPKTVDLKDLLGVLSSIRTAIEAAAIDAGESKKEVFLSLNDISDQGSALITIGESEAASVGTFRVSKALREDDLSLIPRKSRVEMRKVWTKARQKSWVIYMQNSSPTDAIIDPAKAFPAMAQIRGYTSLCALAMRVGGAKPRVLLKFPNGEKRTFDVAGEDLAKQIGARLYQQVVIHGEAKWFVSTKKLADFKVTKLGAFSQLESDPGTAIASLTDAIGRHWQGIDPEAYLREERSCDGP